MPQSRLKQTLEEMQRALEACRACEPLLDRWVDLTVQVFQNQGKVLLCGNGGSHAQAQHLAVEYTVRFKKDRPPLPAVALSSDPAYLTAHTNDMGFEGVFARQVEALGEPGDLLVALSTSGRSRNVLHALETARNRGLYTVFLTGPHPAPTRADLVIRVPVEGVARIQEIHLLLGHVWVDAVEERLGYR